MLVFGWDDLDFISCLRGLGRAWNVGRVSAGTQDLDRSLGQIRNLVESSECRSTSSIFKSRSIRNFGDHDRSGFPKYFLVYVFEYLSWVRSRGVSSCFVSEFDYLIFTRLESPTYFIEKTKSDGRLQSPGWGRIQWLMKERRWAPAAFRGAASERGRRGRAAKLDLTPS